jgi:hypothetical protein
MKIFWDSLAGSIKTLYSDNEKRTSCLHISNNLRWFAYYLFVFAPFCALNYFLK